MDPMTRLAARTLALLAAVSLATGCGPSLAGDAEREGSGARSPATRTSLPVASARPTAGIPAPVAPDLVPAGPTSAPSLPAPLSPVPSPTAAPTTAPTAVPDAGSVQGGTVQRTPPPTLSPRPTAVALDPPPRPGRFTLDLYEPNDYVPQYDEAWCVPASMQMMINLMDTGRPDRSHETQRELYDLARRWSPWLVDRPGASTHGWVGGLQLLGHGSFSTIPSETSAEALRLAARQMRLTRKPVGLLVWEGDHAWVMSGFKATGDPAYTDDYAVTAVWIEDPWFGRVSRRWGAGLEPHTLIRADDLGRDFTRWASEHRPEYGPRGKFVIVAPLS